MEQIPATPHTERQFSSLADIRAYKEELRGQIKADEHDMAVKWDMLFHRKEPAPRNKAQKFARMLSLGSGMLDGALLGWKLYRKYKEGTFLFGKRKRK